ncbi:MAG TPA: hypothetical protein GXX18_05975 [Bacillales bacterium]|nr:hypothetical protein [Bacillales bacterium]
MSEQLLKEILEELHDIKTEQQTTNLRLDRIEIELTDIKESVAVIANDQKNDVINMLTKIDENITDVKSRVRNIKMFKIANKM